MLVLLTGLRRSVLQANIASSYRGCRENKFLMNYAGIGEKVQLLPFSFTPYLAFLFFGRGGRGAAKFLWVSSCTCRMKSLVNSKYAQ